MDTKVLESDDYVEKYQREMLTIIKEYKNKQTKKIEDLVPLIIVPSLLGAQIFATLNKTHSEHIYCEKKKKEFTLWIDVLEVLKIDCLFENLGMTYENGQFKNYPGVETRVKDIGGLSTVEFLDKQKKMPIWDEIITILKEIGYTPEL
eukprot:EC824848.1.p1 GENE.EC824848.1~~EC824848.1.p1  ORF type:complete len:148 (+),score=42.88 EC824848.1:137-580(+)